MPQPRSATNKIATPASARKTEKAAPNTNGSTQTNVQSTLDPNPEDHKDPLDFETLPIEVLRKYRQVHKLNVPSAMRMDGYLLAGSVGKKTYSYKNNQRTSKAELAAAVKKHFLAQNVRESDCLVEFIYSVRRQDEAFKLQFS